MANGTAARSTARLLERRHVTRAGMSRIAVMAAVGAAIWFTRPDTIGGLAGSAFLVAVLFCDSVRERMRVGRRDALTLWLAAMLAQLREYVVYLGLAIGAVLAGIGGAWGWAAGALVALALRDCFLVAREAPPAPPARPCPPGDAEPSDDPRHPGPGRRSAPLADLARRVLIFPQPVRFLAIAVTATLWDARVSFITLIVGCVVAVTAALVDPSSARGRR
ncbi:hypothetical protein PWG71_07045 [Nocardiopsis sp. N85]|uniref:hypothetical protein n=1 Tax=Nocardiopsis sp. N85 TaxID=3029400 RepID=UPI00237F18CF|nr:hypothetical protein [Nocardiopsis sp. N85]MDE3721140.1 hypothetical protein [Nocardiopsis sp. N85]